MLKITKALGDQNRLRILHLLSEGELCACEL
ncbi:ArsR family transcriptional regulator, partial [Proteiniclasticum sp.]